MSYKCSTLLVTLDSGATVSYIQLQKAIELGLNIQPNNQLALLADKRTRMASLGEVDFVATLNSSIQLRIRALVMKHLQAECFGGTNFHVDNNLEANIKSGKILIHGRYSVDQFNQRSNIPVYPPPDQNTACHPSSSRIMLHNHRQMGQHEQCNHLHQFENSCSSLNQNGNPCSGPNQFGNPCSGSNQLGYPCSGPNQIGNPCSGPI